ncbi:MAG TPA: prepilin peptidase [Longimicrobiaceae bacterium]|nr:prepilin peptidase [Longimicrobiaceae bacterium]
MTLLPEWFLWVAAGLVGACLGSFLNVCIYRLPAGESVVAPRSRCPECGLQIAWYDNVPVLSYLLLRGRCRGCGTRISPQYPIVELVTALVWVAAVVRNGPTWQALSVAVFVTLLLGIALTDARTYIIPNEFSVGGAVLGLLLALAPGGVTIRQAVIGAVLGFAVLWLAAVLGEWWLKKPAMGGGDIKMMAMIGAFLGPLGALLSIFLGALAGTLIFLPISLKTRKLVPFGIFLAFGAAIAQGWGGEILHWYQSTFLV